MQYDLQRMSHPVNNILSGSQAASHAASQIAREIGQWHPAFGLIQEQCGVLRQGQAPDPSSNLVVLVT
jgi:hypothetical protein